MTGQSTCPAAEKGHPSKSGAALRASVSAFVTVVALSPIRSSAAPVEEIRQIIADPRGTAAPGCAMGAFRDGQTLFFQASGAADVATRRPLDENTLFYAASTSKQFTVLAAAKLVEQGKLDLDDDVRKWLPELPAYAKPITVKMLVHHTAGIRDWLGLAKLVGAPNMGNVERSAALNLLFRQKSTNFVPGTKFDYSNGGYLLLSEVVERASGLPFHDFAKTALFVPMGMDRSYFVHGTRPGGDNVAHGYVPAGAGFEVKDTYPLTGGSGGLITSIAELAKYDRDVQLTHKVWTPAVARIMLTPGTLSDGSTAEMGKPYNMPYAGGLMVGLHSGRYVFWHGGGAQGFLVNYINLPDRHLGIAIFCNRSDADAVEKSYAIIDVLEETALSSGRASRGSASQAATAPKKEYSPIAKPEMSGVYVSDELNATYRVTTPKRGTTEITISSPWAKPGSASAKLGLAVEKGASPDSGRYQLVPTDGSASLYGLVLDEDGNGFTINADGDGRVSGLHFKRTAKR